MNESREQIIDEILVMDSQAGSTKAMEMLVWRWQKRLWQYAFSLTTDAEAAWDITQETLSKRFKAINTNPKKTPALKSCWKNWT